MPLRYCSDGRYVVALVATRDRAELLRTRAIPSILNQKRLPDRLLVVVDCTKEELSEPALKDSAKSIQAQCATKLHATVLRNVRTRHRAAGAWNTGVDTLHRDAKLVGRPD